MKPNAASDTSPKPRCATDVTRRRLFKTGLAAAPVVLTLASRPVLAAQCKTASAAASANLSRPQGLDVSGTLTISQWIASSSWPSPYTPTDKFSSATVSSVFGGSTKYGNPAAGDANATLLDVLTGSTVPQSSQLDKDLIVALLNRTLIEPAGQCVATSDLNKMFIFGTNGMYQPIAGGAFWGPAEIHTYLLNNGLLGG